MKKIALILASAFLLAACDGWQADLPVAVELGHKLDPEGEDEFFTLPSSEGIFELPIFASGKGSLSVTEGADWLALDHNRFDRDDTVYVEYAANPGFSRIGSILLKTNDGERRDTVIIRQQGGRVPTFAMASSAVVLNGAGPNVFPVETNLSTDELEITVTYPDDPEKADWIRSITVDPAAGTLTVDQIDNTSRILVKKATVSVIFPGEWGRRQRFLLYLTQANADNMLGSGVDFPYIRSLATEKGGVIADDIYVEAYVISDKASGNVHENTLTDYKTIDYTVVNKAAYVESIDGNYGFLILTRTEEDNIFENNTKVQLLLSGAYLQKFTDPERYVISRVSGDMVSRSEAVDPALIPVKENHISDFTDQDLYTRVKVKDVELSMRKGSLSPINNNYSNGKNQSGVPNGYTTKWPTLMHDATGATMFLWTNTTCLYRQDGSKLGYGKGDVSGVLVHEKYRPYVDKDAPAKADCGNIGRYQVRHMAKSDIGFSQNDDDALFGLVTEYRYLGAANEDRSWQPTDGECASAFNHSYLIATSGTGAFKAAGSEYYANCRRPVTYTYLGPIGVTADTPFGLNTGNVNGHGIILPDESKYGLGDQTYTNAIGDGKTDNSSPYPTGWRQDFWAKDPDGDPESGDEVVYEWLVWFSTKDVSTSLLTMQFSAQNQNTSSGGSPRYWKAEWSLSGDVSKDEDWTLLLNYVVPDHMMGGTTRDNLCAGFKVFDIKLPSELIGKDKVWVRFKPADRRCGNAASYDEADLFTLCKTANATRCAMDYFAVKYLK